MRLIYSLIILPLIIVFAHVAALFTAKVRKPLFARYNVFDKIKASVPDKINTSKNTVIIHSSSMGEFEHIKPLIRQIKNNFDVNIVVTFFSPSGYNNVKKFNGVGLFLYLPFDFINTWARFYRELNARLLIISKHDVWPNQIRAAQKFGVSTILVNASIGMKSSRTSIISRLLLAKAYRSMDRLFVISSEDAQRFEKSFKCKNIDIAGDTKFDQVLLRKQESVKKELIDKSWLAKNTILIFGSLWPQDAEHVLHDIQALLKEFPELKIIIVPHQPEQEIIAEFTKHFGSLAFTYYTDKQWIKSSSILVVDKIGVLADLYKYADIAYVGGSFKQGIHNVMEPAIYGIPVIYGPNHTNSFEARQLNKAGGGIVINNAAEFKENVAKLLQSIEYRRQVGSKAKHFANKNTGSTEKILSYIHTCI